MDLLGMLKDQVAGTLAGQASTFLGESGDGVGKALEGIFPALLGSTIESAKDEAGAGKLMDLMKGMDMDSLGDIAGIFGGGASGVSKLMNQGSGILNLLLGNKTGGMIDMIAKFAGLRGSSASSLIKMAAPFLIKMIGKQVLGSGKGVGGLMDLLSGQKKSVAAAMPSALASGLGFNFMDKIGDLAGGAMGAGKDAVGDTYDAGKKVISGAAGTVGNVAGAAGDVATKAGGSILKWLIPAALILLGLGYFGFGGKMGDKAVSMTENVAGAVGDVAKDAAGTVVNAADAVVDAGANAVDAAADMASKAFGNINAAAKAALDKITFTAGSAGSQMMDYINGGMKGKANFTFRNLNFASGSANIAGETGLEIDNVAAILKTYPDVKLAVTGFTDNTGDAAKNVTLSKARAEAVKTRLVSKGGIAANRISTGGQGSANPVGDNGTAEGRKANRRIEMTLVK